MEIFLGLDFTFYLNWETKHKYVNEVVEKN